MKTKLIILLMATTVLVALNGCKNKDPLDQRHDALPKISEDILGVSGEKAELILKQNGFIESDEAHMPENGWRLSTYSVYPEYAYSKVKYYVRGEKDTPERNYGYDEWLAVGFRDNTLQAFRSMLFPNTTTQGLDAFRSWSDFAWNTACSNPDFWSASLYYGWEDPRNVSYIIDLIYHRTEGSRAEYETAKAEMTDDLIEVMDCYLRYENPKAVMVSYEWYDEQLFVMYCAENTATRFWGPQFLDGPGSSTVQPIDPNQKPTMSWHNKYVRKGNITVKDKLIK